MTEVRYYSRGGNTKALAEIIAGAQGVNAYDITVEKTNEHIDVLFIGGALYAYGIDKSLEEYLDTLSSADIGVAVVFSTSWISKHAITLIKKKLISNGIKVVDEFIYSRGKPSLKSASKYKDQVNKIIESLK